MTTLVLKTAHDTKMGAAKCTPSEFVQSDFMKRHENDYVIIIRGFNHIDQAGYEYVLCTRRNTSHVKSGPELGKTTVNAAIISGLHHAVNTLRIPGNLYIVCATQVGFKGAANNKGWNAPAVNSLVALCNSKKIKLCEVFIQDGSNTVKQLLKKYGEGDLSPICVDKPTGKTSKPNANAKNQNNNNGPAKNIVQNTQCDKAIDTMLIDEKEHADFLL